MKLNLSVINYLLPSQTDELFTESIKSYGKTFWESVESTLVFKKIISDELKSTLQEYGIKYKDGVDENWVTVMEESVKECITEYFLLFIEDIQITNSEELVRAFSKLDLTKADFLPTLDYTRWNKIVDTFKSFTEVQEDQDDRLMAWGTRHSLFCEQPNIKQNITSGQSTPYPISVAGIFKRDFFLETCARLKKSVYWANISVNRDCYQNVDWAMNPRLPHSYEVYWVHNKKAEDLTYSILVPKKAISISNDIKDKTRGLYQD